MNNVKIIAEIGINHNGDINIAKRLILVAAAAGCDYVKFQKRTPDICVPDDQKHIMKSTPWGDMSYIEYKKKTEFGVDDFMEIDNFCDTIGIKWFASVWDEPSIDILSKSSIYNYKNFILKIPSALITNYALLKKARNSCDTLIISTGMSTEDEIERAVDVGNPDVIMHTNSTYPTPVNELNLNYILHLKEKFPNKEIGYSGHEYGLVTTFATIPMGVTWIERHITLDRTMWGSDQSASVEPSGLIKLVKGVRDIEKALSIESKQREVFGGELLKLKSLRK